MNMYLITSFACILEHNLLYKFACSGGNITQSESLSTLPPSRGLSRSDRASDASYPDASCPDASCPICSGGMIAHSQSQSLANLCFTSFFQKYYRVQSVEKIKKKGGLEE